jgi:hypothetical protein
MLILGAIEKTTSTYTLPYNAEKGKEYECIDCKQKVIFRKGDKRVAHFSHYSPTNTCTYFEHPNEGQLHKDTKLKIAQWLKEKKRIAFTWSCCECHCWPAMHNDNEIELKYSDNDDVVVEYRDPKGKYIADIAVLNNNKVKYIIEIKDTHTTTTNVRPEPWYEVSVKSVEESIKTNNECIVDGSGDPLTLDCERKSILRCCNTCRAIKEDWTFNIPLLDKKIGQEGAWNQLKDCIHCGRTHYNPVFKKGFRQVCKICLGEYYDDIKKKYLVQECMIIDD